MKKIYTDRISKFEDQRNALKKKSVSIAWFRVLSFFFAATLVTIFANEKSTEGIVTAVVVFLVSFLFFLKRHVNIKAQLSFKEALLNINEEELARLEMKLSDLEDGSEFIKTTHEYHTDLDIFGKHSLFQLLNRTSTNYGKQTLVDWLSRPSVKPEIERRQKAVKEVSGLIDWRQNIAAVGRANHNEKASIDSLLVWISEESTVLKQKFYSIALVIFPLFSLVAITLSFLGLAPIGLVLLAVVFNIVILVTVFTRAGSIYQKTIDSNQLIKAYEAQIRYIEEQPLKSELLIELKGRLQSDNQKASVIVKQLQFILDNLHNRANLMYHIFNLLFILDVYWVIRAEKWKERTKENISDWFEAIGEIEAINSLGGFHFSNPSFTFPIIEEEPFVIKATQMGHPLINAKKRVSNDFDFSGKGGICLITGSNMSGKSTFLRTVGVNSTLALLGAPVCAESMHISRLQVFTSMRTQDDLEESVSSFYAELKRLKQLLNSINTEIPTLFMVDEVLKGTNSEDRHTGAIALIRQLNKSHAFGFVSTHDLALGQITTELKGVKNYSFNSIIENDDIIFDYTLTPGICKSFNATKLMQKMGIEIID